MLVILFALIPDQSRQKLMVQVGTSQRTKGADYAIESIHNIKEALRKLWDEDTENSDDVICSAKVAIETSVTA